MAGGAAVDARRLARIYRADVGIGRRTSGDGAAPARERRAGRQQGDRRHDRADPRVGKRRLDIVKLLLSRGANPAAARAGLTARQLAVSRGYPEVATVLEGAEALGADLLKAANEGQATTMRQLLARGAPANTTNADGVSSLMFAARNGDLGTLQYLLSRGADAVARDRQGQGVFEWAERSPSTRQQVAAFLRERGLRPQAAAPSSRTAPTVTASLQSLDALLAKAAPSTAPGRAAQKRAATALARLRSLSAAWPAESPEDYRINLAADVQALSSALARSDPADPAAVSRSRRRRSRSEARTLSEERRQAGRVGAGARTHGAVGPGSGQVAGLLHAAHLRGVAERGARPVSRS